jgi:alpha-1,2-mannosyltransferase
VTSSALGRATLSRASRPLRLAQLCISTIALGSLVGGSLGPVAYTKDIQVEYLTAWALRDGVDVFTPLTELSARYFPAATTNFPHPSPHPPVLALISLPLTLLPFPIVVVLWLALNIWLVFVVGRWLGLSTRSTMSLAAWPPLWCLLYIGQYELVILALAMLGWRAAAAGRDWRAGFWLGTAAAIKLYPVTFLLPFLARRRIRVLLGAAVIFALSQVGNLATVGPRGVVRYYREIVPAVSGRYVRTALNSSPYGGLLRLFGGADDVAPLVNAPGVVRPAAVCLSLFAVAALLRLEPQAAPLAMLVALPGAWSTYVVLALPEMVALLRVARLRYVAALAGAAASLVLPLTGALLIGYVRLTGNHTPPTALVLALQPVGIVGLLALSMARSRINPRDAAHANP